MTPRDYQNGSINTDDSPGGFRHPKRQGRSQAMQEKAIDARRRPNQIVNDSELWTPYEDNLLLELFLKGKGRNLIAEVVEHPVRACMSRLTRLAHRNKRCSYYKGTVGRNREDVPWSPRDVQLVKWARSDNKDRALPLSWQHLSNLLARPVKQIQDKLDDNLFGTTESQVESEDSNDHNADFNEILEGLGKLLLGKLDKTKREQIQDLQTKVNNLKLNDSQLFHRDSNRRYGIGKVKKLVRKLEAAARDHEARLKDLEKGQ